MKAWHFLQVSSQIIGKNRYRSDVLEVEAGFTADLRVANSID
jgi:hypothetical protein